MIAAGLRGHIDDTAAGPTSLSWRNTSFNFEFRNGIRWRIDSDLSEISFVVIYPIQREVIVGRASPVYYQHRTT